MALSKIEGPVEGVERADSRSRSVYEAVKVGLSKGAVPLPAELPDPEDVPFLEVAASTGAILVTGNTRHYPKRLLGGVMVLSPREFLELLRRSP